MTPDPILCEKAGPIWRVTLNRPQKANAISLAMLKALDRIVGEAEAASDLRALIITGAGQRVFCAGADLGEIDFAGDHAKPKLWETMPQRLVQLPVFTIAAINGACMGGGLILALSCDVRLAVGGVRFAYPALKNGVLPGKVDAMRLNALVGPGRARAILLGGMTINAATANQWGLVDLLADDDDLMVAVNRLADNAVLAPAGQVAAMKRVLGEG